MANRTRPAVLRALVFSSRFARWPYGADAERESVGNFWSGKLLANQVQDFNFAARERSGQIVGEQSAGLFHQHPVFSAFRKASLK